MIRLEELQRAVAAAIEMEKSGALVPMSASEIDMFHKLYPGVEMVIGDFMVMKRAPYHPIEIPLDRSNNPPYG